MKRVAGALADLAREIAALSERVGQRVEVDVGAVADRSDAISLAAPGVWSPNRSCRMVKAADGWIAVNLPRESDLLAVPAWIGCGLEADPWTAVVRLARSRCWRDLVAQARLLGLPVCGVGEVSTGSPAAALRRMSSGRPAARTGPPRVLDLSSLWAGPLCGSILAAAGCQVTKLESRSRPDVMRTAAPAFYRRLNGAKAAADLDLTAAGDVRRLGDLIAGADVVITSARPRAFEQFGTPPEAAFSANPGLVWVAISGYGWIGEGSDRVAFGDDAAAAGGLVRWTLQGRPRFLGDALADPLTGLAAAAGALQALSLGGGVLVDAAMARTSAGVAGGTGGRRGSA